MRRTKVVHDFMTYPVVKKLPFYRNISIQLADTSLFPNLPIPLTMIHDLYVSDADTATPPCHPRATL